VIYAIRAVGTKYIKFGLVNETNVGRRLSTLQIGCPFELEILAIGAGGLDEEREIHRILTDAGKHHRGEWFTESEETDRFIEWIKTCKQKPKPIPQMMDRTAGRLSRALSYGKTLDLETAKRSRQQRDYQRSQLKTLAPSSTASSKATETAHQFMQSLMTWESNTLRSIASSLSTESPIGEMQRSAEH
jgi:hypothetical protein